MAAYRMDGARLWANDRFMDARGWTAPRIVRMSHFIQEDFSPRVGSALTATARKIEPPRRRRRGRLMIMGLLAVCGAVGVAGAMAARRGAERMAADQVDEESAGEPAKAARSQASVNGQVQAL